MVIRERQYVSIEEAVRIVLEAKNKREMVTRLHKLPKRQKAPPPPEGGIGVREAARKYGVSRMTISRLASSGKVSVILRTPNWLYVSDKDLKKYFNGNRRGNGKKER